MTWPTVPGMRYRVAQALDLRGAWEPMDGTAIVEGDGSEATVVVPLSAASENLFYRVELVASLLDP